MAYKEEDYLMLSGVQHFLFCKRQWALIHVEDQWKENLLTTEGKLLHKKAHNEALVELRGDVLILRGLWVSSSSLGVSGQCDVVEFHKNTKGVPLNGRDDLWIPFPVEYKRGKPKANHCDEAQLCAEAMCLEEMLSIRIEKGALFYGTTKRRKEVIFTDNLRKLVIDSFREMHQLLDRGYTPKSRNGKKCASCSLKEVCLPVLETKKSVKEYVRNTLCENS